MSRTNSENPSWVRDGNGWVTYLNGVKVARLDENGNLIILGVIQTETQP